MNFVHHCIAAKSKETLQKRFHDESNQVVLSYDCPICLCYVKLEHHIQEMFPNRRAQMFPNRRALFDATSVNVLEAVMVELVGQLSKHLLRDSIISLAMTKASCL